MNYVNDKNIYVGKRVIVHAYKFNGWLYRSWEFPIVIAKTKDYYVLGSDDAEIITAKFNTKRYFKSTLKKRCFWVLFKDKWYNMIITVQDNNKLSYYINISSKFIYEESAFKYYDFDLDFKVSINGSWCEVDIKEFEQGIINYGYSEELIKIIRDVEQEIKELLTNKTLVNEFNIERVNDYNQIFNQLSSEKWKTRKLNLEELDNEHKKY